MATDDAFAGKARQYAQHRTDYPAAFLASAFARVALGPGARVAELGSGTGLLSRHLLLRGACVAGVEPSAEMRAEAERALQGVPGFVSVSGSAEATSLPDSSFDVLVAGNAFHYFDPVRTRREADRILVWGGRMLLLDHRAPEHPAPFMAAYLAFVRRWTPVELTLAHAGDDLPKRVATFFQDREYAYENVLEQTYSMSWDNLRDRFLSTSIAPCPSSPDFGEVLADLQAVFDAHQQGGAVPFVLQWVATWSLPSQTVADPR